MRGATPVNDEFEVGFDQDFENRWHYAELAGRGVMALFTAAGLAGLLGRGPLSHERAYAAESGLSVDYEPVARHTTATTVTVHVKNDTPLPRPVIVAIDQKMIEPMGLQSTAPLADSATLSDSGISLRFIVQPDQEDALIRLNLQPTAIGPVRLTVDDGMRHVAWSTFVAP